MNRILSSLAIALVAGAPVQAQAGSTPQDQGALALQRPQTRDLTGASVHRWSLSLGVGEYAEVSIEQNGIDLSVRLVSPAGVAVWELNRQGPGDGETARWVADTAGAWTLELMGLADTTVRGTYNVHWTVQRTAQERDRDIARADALSAASTAYFRNGDAEAARPLAEEAIAVLEKTLGPDHPEVFDSVIYLANQLNFLAFTHYSQGSYGLAEPLFERVLAILERALGPDHYIVADALNNLANLNADQADYTTARPLYERALAIQEQTDGLDQLSVARSLHNLATLVGAQGDYATARALYERALEIRERSLGPDHPDVADTLNNLGSLHQKQNDEAAAQPLFERALAIREQTLGPDHPMVARSLNNLATLYSKRGNYATAQPLFERALAILEPVVGPNHPYVALLLTNLGLQHQGQGDPAASLPLFERALAIQEEVLGPDHPDVAHSLTLLAHLHYNLGDPDTAETLFDRAITLLDATIFSPQTRIRAYAGRARLLHQTGDPDSALDDLEEALLAAEELRPQASGDEESRAAFFETYADDFDLMVQWQLEAGDFQAAFEYAERARARALLDQLQAGKIDLRSSMAPDIRAALEARETQAQNRLAEDQQQLTLVRGRADLPDDERLRRIAALEVSLQEADAEYKRIYSEIKNASPLWRDLITSGGAPVALSTVQRRLVPENGLMLVYQIGATASHVLVVPQRGQPTEALPLNISTQAASAWGVEAGALTAEQLRLRLAGSDEANEAGEAGTIPDLSTRGILPPTPRGATLADHLHLWWQTLVPESLRERLLQATEVVIIPDGPLHALPFESLVIEQAEAGPRYWLDAGPVIRYAPSATVLHNINQRPARRGFTQSGEATVLSVSDPIYDPGELAETPSARESYERSGRSLARLPGTARESTAIVAAYGDRAPRQVVRLQGAQASEAQLRQALQGKRYLHLATHGLVDERRGTLFASLALTPPEGTEARLDNDGFLQLHEIYDLDLGDVELAVLSACQTAVGTTVEGEGVFALSRGFLAAGARRVVASQWSVDDASTAVLMGAFFEAIVAAEQSGRGINYAQALWQARKAVRAQADWEDPFYWAPFVLTGMR